jgi:hypothetical protein
MSRIGYKPRASISISYVSPLHLIEGKGMYTLYYSTIVDYMTLRDPVDAKGGPLTTLGQVSLQGITVNRLS